MADKIQISQETCYLLLYATGRYALGRQSYVVGDVCATVRHLGAHLLPGQLAVIIRDIEEHGRRGDDAYGQECDRREWMDLLAWLRFQVSDAEAAS